MAAPIVLGLLALCAGGTGTGAAISGIKDYWKLFQAKKETNKHCKEILKRHEEKYNDTQKELDKLGELELTILDSFSRYSKLIAKIQNRPEFDQIPFGKIQFSAPKLDELNSVALVANTLLRNLGNASFGALSAFATAGAVPSIVATIATASTGTSISALSGAAMWNATLAVIGGGSLAAGGGGIALGAAILSSLSCGIGILVGGAAIKLTGRKMRKKHEKDAENQITLTEEKVEKLCEYLAEIKELSGRFSHTLNQTMGLYNNHMDTLSPLLEADQKMDWNHFSRAEQQNIKKTTALVTLLYNMCTVQLTVQTSSEDGTLISMANTEEVNQMISHAETKIAEITKKSSLLHKLFSKK